MDESINVAIGKAIRASSSDEAYGEALRATLTQGHRVDAGGRPSSEILGLQVRLDDPRDRLITNPAYRIGLISTVARFTWMMGGNERLEDIAVYQPLVRRFTDDALIVPGSNYGKRLVAPRPGLNQIEGVIGRLAGAEDNDFPGSSVRRASAVIWEADDAVRRSKDIPCAFGVMYAVRDGHLIARTVMRSNNGPTLLAVNLFEFGLLAELVATEVGVELGPLIHDVFSFHIYEVERERAEASVAGWDRVRDAARHPMPPMAASPSPLAQTRVLARLETELAHDLDGVREADPRDLLARGAEELNDYWLAFYRVLLAHALCRTARFHVAREVAEQLPSYFQHEVIAHVEKQRDEALAAGSGQLFPEATPEHRTQLTAEDDDPTAKLRRLCKEIEAQTDLAVTLREYELLEEQFVTGALARRSEKHQFTRDEVQQALWAARAR